MQMLVGFGIVFTLLGGIGFYFGLRNGKKHAEKQWEDEIRYVTIEDMENMAAEMRDSGAEDDSIFVVVRPDWWENEK